MPPARDFASPARFAHLLPASAQNCTGWGSREQLARAVERLGEADFTRADILLVSDGEFDVTAATQQKLAQARNEYGVRLHGVLIGAANGEAMRTLCERDTLHRFADWADLARLPQGPSR